jgi:phospholipase C
VATVAWSFRHSIRCAYLGAALAALALSACRGGTPGPASALPPQAAQPLSKDAGAYIQHIVVVVQENRSFDNLFATFPGADGATEGLMKSGSGEIYIRLKKVNLSERCDFGHGYQGFLRNYDHGKMDGFELAGNKCSGDHTAAYQFVAPAQIAPYWELARRYVLADRMFQTQGSGSFTAHQDLIAGGTTYDTAEMLTMVDYPTQIPWGCDAPPGTVTSRLRWIHSHIVFRYDRGPFPCMKYRTIRDLLDAKSVSWKYYSPPVVGGEGALWNAFDAIKAVRHGSEWGVNVTDSNTEIFSDISNDQLPAVSWVIPDRQNSDHPASGSDTGPSWVASIVNAIGESMYWPNTAIIIIWDDWGGFYDHVPPPFFDQWGGLGFRVPMIVVSAYPAKAQPGKTAVSHRQYEFGSILKFIERTFGLSTLGTTDVRAHDLLDCFNFSQSPRRFQAIPSRYSKSFFLRQRPSYEPVDTE